MTYVFMTSMRQVCVRIRPRIPGIDDREEETVKTRGERPGRLMVGSMMPVNQWSEQRAKSSDIYAIADLIDFIKIAPSQSLS